MGLLFAYFEVDKKIPITTLTKELFILIFLFPKVKKQSKNNKIIRYIKMFCSKKKKISFDQCIEVFSIPQVENNQQIWWSHYHLHLFKESSKIEIRRLQKIHPAMTFTQATKLLYQPPTMTLIYDPQNFVYE